MFLSKNKKLSLPILGTVLGFLMFLLGYTLVNAQGFVPLVGIPNVPTNTNLGIPGYINAIYLLVVGVGSLIAVIKIAIAGIKWSMSEIITDKSSARKDIQGALLGLAILLIPFIVLSTINPKLTNLNVLESIKPITTRNIPSPGVPPGTSVVLNPSMSVTERQKAIAQIETECIDAGGVFNMQQTASGLIQCNVADSEQLKNLSETPIVPGSVVTFCPAKGSIVGAGDNENLVAYQDFGKLFKTQCPSGSAKFQSGTSAIQSNTCIVFTCPS